MRYDLAMNDTSFMMVSVILLILQQLGVNQTQSTHVSASLSHVASFLAFNDAVNIVSCHFTTQRCLVGRSWWLSAAYSVISRGYNKSSPNVYRLILCYCFLCHSFPWWVRRFDQITVDRKKTIFRPQVIADHIFSPTFSVGTKSLQSYSTTGLELKWQSYLQCPFNLLINIVHLISRWDSAVSPPSITMPASGIIIVSIPVAMQHVITGILPGLSVVSFNVHLHWTGHQLKAFRRPS